MADCAPSLQMSADLIVQIRNILTGNLGSKASQTCVPSELRAFICINLRALPNATQGGIFEATVEFYIFRKIFGSILI